MTVLSAPEPASAPTDSDYWLHHCEGFRVDAAGGRLGFVEDVQEEPGRLILLIRAGRLGRSVLRVSADEVAEIRPREMRVRLRSPVRAEA